MHDAEISEDDKEQELNSPSAEVSEESERNGDQIEGKQRVVSIFIGNLSDGTGPTDIKDLFESYGITVDHVDMKVCFAFVHCVWVSNLPEIVDNMQGAFFRNSPKIPKIEISKGDGDTRRREERRNKSQAPSCSLFVIGFDPMKTTEEAITSTFAATAAVQKIMMRKNFCFVKFSSINEAEKVKDAFHGQEVWGRTLSIQFSSGNPLDSNPRRDRNTDLRGDADGVRALDERGRGDSPSNRGSTNRSNSGGYTDGRGGDGGGGGGGREGDTGMNRSNRSGNVDSNDRGRDMPQHEDKRSSDGSGYQYQNQKRLNVPDVIDRECRTRDNFGNRNGNGAGNEHGIGDSNCREGNRLKSNFINRSRSRDRGRDRGDRRNSNDNDNGNGNGNGNGYGFNNDRSGNNNNNINNSSGRMNDRNGQDVDVGNTSNQKFDMPSISVIALPFGVSGGRFLYEHPDGRREYVEAMLSSSNSSSSSCHAVSGSGSPNNSRGRGRGSIRGHSNPRQNQYSSVSGEKRRSRSRSRPRLDRIRQDMNTVQHNITGSGSGSREDGRHFPDHTINGNGDLNLNEVHKSSSKGRISRSR